MSQTPAPHIEPLFATPLVIDEPPASAIAAEVLADALVALSGDGCRDAGAAWTSHDLSSISAAVSGVEAHARSLAARMTIDVKKRSAPRQWIYSASAAVIGPNEALSLQPRYDAFWQGLYVVRDGYVATDGQDQAAAGGTLILEDPRLPASAMERPDLRMLLQGPSGASLSAPEMQLRPRTGWMLLWPGWLRVRHVPLAAGTGPRLLVLFSLIAALDA